MYDALSRTHKLKTTEQRDMLYGFYGLLQVLSDCRLPAPDLNLPVPLVWMNGTIAMIRGSQSLRVMQDVVNDDRCQVHRHGYLCPQQRSRLAKQDLVEPRWTHLWRNAPREKALGWTIQDYRFNHKPPRNTAWDRAPELWSAQDSKSPLGEITAMSGSLVVQGVRLDVIHKRNAQPDFMTRLLDKSSSKDSGVELDEALGGQSGMFISMTYVLREWLDIIQKSRERSPPADIFHDMMMFELNPVALYGADYGNQAVALDIRTWCEVLMKSSSSGCGDLSHQREVASILAEDLKNMHGKKFAQQICINIIWKCAFRTAEGRVGYTWYTAEEGDLLVLLCWSRMPAILRPMRQSKLASSELDNGPERYLLVGFAYVHGLMDCSKWPMQEDKLEDFILV